MRGGERERDKVVAKPENRDRVRGSWRVVRGARLMAPSMARDRWHRPWRAIDDTVRGAIDGTVDNT